MKQRLPALLLAALPLPSGACALADATRLELDHGLALWYRIEPPPLKPARHFSMRFRVCDGDAGVEPELFKIDARMPAHNHGMNYHTALSRADDGSIAAAGMLFHMPGWWQVSVDLAYRGQRQSLDIDYRI